MTTAVFMTGKTGTEAKVLGGNTSAEWYAHAAMRAVSDYFAEEIPDEVRINETADTVAITWSDSEGAHMTAVIPYTYYKRFL